MAQLEKPWTKTTLFQNLKEVTEEGYQQMLAYEAAGGTFDMIDLSAKKYYEKYVKRKAHKNNNNVVMHTDAGEDAGEDTEWMNTNNE